MFFNFKCEADYKIAGLYVIDAIIRHSRYQYLQNDLFAPRFAKNLYKTFVHLYKCPINEQVNRDKKKNYAIASYILSL